jgi:hypothetical protein
MTARIAVGLPACAQATYRSRDDASNEGIEVPQHRLPTIPGGARCVMTATRIGWANTATPASIDVYLGAACPVARDRSKDDR